MLQPVVSDESLELAPLPVVMRFEPDPAPVSVVEPVIEEINSRSFMPELDQAPISAMRDQRRTSQTEPDFESPPPQQRATRRNFRAEPEPDFEAPPPPDPNRRNYRAEPEPDFEASPPRRQPMPPSNFSRNQPTVAPRDDFSATAPAPTPGSYVSPALTQQRGFAPGNDWDEPAPTANATAPRFGQHKQAGQPRGEVLESVKFIIGDQADGAEQRFGSWVDGHEGHRDGVTLHVSKLLAGDFLIPHRARPPVEMSPLDCVQSGQCWAEVCVVDEVFENKPQRYVHFMLYAPP